MYVPDNLLSQEEEKQKTKSKKQNEKKMKKKQEETERKEQGKEKVPINHIGVIGGVVALVCIKEGGCWFESPRAHSFFACYKHRRKHYYMGRLQNTH